MKIATGIDVAEVSSISTDSGSLCSLSDNSTKGAIKGEIIGEYSDRVRSDRRVALESDYAILVGHSQTFPVDLVNVSRVTGLDQAILAIAPKNEEFAAHETDFLGLRLALLDHAGDLFGELLVIPSGVDRLRFHRPTSRQRNTSLVQHDLGAIAAGIVGVSIPA